MQAKTKRDLTYGDLYGKPDQSYWNENDLLYPAGTPYEYVDEEPIEEGYSIIMLLSLGEPIVSVSVDFLDDRFCHKCGGAWITHNGDGSCVEDV